MRNSQNLNFLLSKKAFLLPVVMASACIVSAEPVLTMTPHADAVNSVSQTKVIKGVVNDQYGAVIGANVHVKGTTIGTITDMDGGFSLEVPLNSTLEISYIGYLTQEVKVTSATRDIRVVLKEDTETLEEVVVVGYGTQKKVNMSGSVSSINVNELTESRPITNVSQALAGVAAGVSVMSNSNQPGNDNASIKVRGQGTLNNSDPLVIIDGAEAGINTINPQDIESISILKDAASAAIYGSRAANGVILITTKQGKSGNIKLDYNGYVSFVSTSIPDHMDPVSNYADYMELINEGYLNSNSSPKFSQGVIDEWRADGGRDPLRYPNTNWLDETFDSSVAHNHVVSLSGGSEKIKFYSSFGYQNNPGVMENTGFEKYNARLNMSADVKKWLNITAQVNGYVSNMDPAAKYKSSGSTVSDVFKFASATTPGMVFRAPDGRFGAMNNSEDDAQAAGNNPLMRLNTVAGGIRKTNMRSRFIGTLKPFKGFTLTGSYSYEFVDEERKSKPIFVDGWNFKEERATFSNKRKSQISNYDGKVERFFNDIVARYETRVVDDRLGINAMLGASQEKYRSHNFSASKYDMIDTSLGVLNGAVGDASAGGSSAEWAMRSYFGRVNLDWDQKYLLEVNLRADQSSRFLKSNRTGYFPSASFAWRVDQEKFMKKLLDKGLSSLKLRLSYGSLGNNAVGNYDALALYANKTDGNPFNYCLNNSLALGLAQGRLANPALSWESTYMTNVGLDFGFFNSRLTGTIDYFHKKTKDILINLPAPDVHGTAAIPKQNSAEVLNQGVELSLGWQDNIGKFHYSVNGNFTYVKNEVTKYKGKDKGGITYNGASIIWEGHPINSQYLLRYDRIIQTDEDLALVQQMIDNAPVVDGKKVNPFAAFGTPEKGDLLYKDINGDGIVDLNDREIVSDGPNPKFQFGLNLTASYKGIDFAVLLQGQAGAKVYWQNDLANTSSVRYGYQLNKEVVDGRWYEGRTNATYPRLLEYSNQKNKQMSDFYLENLSFLKIRNIQIGYTLPSKWTKCASLERVRFYGSLENFFTFTSFRGFDPEMGASVDYPAMKSVVLGVNLSF